MRRCEIGGCHEPADRCHIRSRGSGGSSKQYNLIWMCRKHHEEQHRTGLWTFAKKYGLVRRFQTAYDKEREMDKAKVERALVRRRRRKATRICPTCKRPWRLGQTIERS